MQSAFLTVGPTFLTLSLAARYTDYMVIGCKSMGQALDTLTHLKAMQVPIALLLADQCLPDGSGAAFLAQAHLLVPAAHTVLVTVEEHEDTTRFAYGKIDAVLHTCLPAEEFCYPVLDDLLAQSMRQQRDTPFSPVFTGIEVIGHPWSAPSHEVKDFLARHSVPFRWVDLENFGRQEGESHDIPVLAQGRTHAAFPLLHFPDGTWLVQPSPAQIAAKIGLSTSSMRPFYDLIIVGAGPAGLAAAIYGASEGFSTALIECDAPGGQAGTSSRIENYPGFPVGLSGTEFANRTVAQAARLGAHLITQTVTGVRIEDPYRVVTLADGSELGCYGLVLSTGVNFRPLQVPGAEPLTSAGVYYGAAMTEATTCQGKEICIVGGANSAGQAALYFSDFAAHVHLLVRASSLQDAMSAYLIEEIESRANIVVQTQTQVIACQGDEQLQHVLVQHNGVQETIDARALFVFIGSSPTTGWLPEQIARDASGFLLTGPTAKTASWPLKRDPYALESSIPGIFVAGDVRANSVKRVACATGDGALAVSLLHLYLPSVR